jgi:hypothetical protein
MNSMETDSGRQVWRGVRTHSQPFNNLALTCLSTIASEKRVHKSIPYKKWSLKLLNIIN